MDTTNRNQTNLEEERIQVNREELATRIMGHTHKDGEVEILPGLFLGRLSRPSERIHSVLKPSFCVIAQGSKVVFVGDSRYQYDPFNYCLTTVDLPRVSQVLDASRERPYLSLRLELDPSVVGSVLVEAGHVTSSSNIDVRAIDVSSLDADLLDAVVRLVRLVDSPNEVRILMPLITREIIYRLLMGDQGGRLGYLLVSSSHTPGITKAIRRIREDFDKSFRMEDLAEELGMSTSSFYHHFKSITAMSPLQYQKRLRLQEARRLMLGEDLDASSAAYRVGYNDAAHFSREYKSHFGQPPMRDVQRLREMAVEITP